MRTLAVLLSASLALIANAAEKPACTRTFHAGITEYGIMHNTETKTGVGDDILAELQRRSKCNIELQTIPINRALKLLEAGALDMQFSVAQLPGREPYGYFANYGAFKNLAVMRQANAVPTLDAFVANPDLKVGTIRGATFGPTYDAMIAELRQHNRVFEASDAPQLFQWLATSRVDLVFSEVPILQPRLKELSMLDRVSVQDWVPKEKAIIGGVLLSRHTFTPQEAVAWQALIDELHNDGTLRKIYRKYLPESSLDPVLQFPPH